MVGISVIDALINLTAGEFPGAIFVHSGVITREKYEARKAERQNKPSWSECPGWAKYVAQDSNGDWYWYSHTPSTGVANGWNEQGQFGFSQRGEVIGKWQDTLEQRPNHIVDPNEKVKAVADVALKFAAVSPGCAASFIRQQMPELFDSAPKLSAADWYDYEKQQAIKLPPVGVQCEYYDGTPYSECKIVAIRGDAAVAFIRPDYDSDIFVSTLSKAKFRPFDWDLLSPEPEPETVSESSAELSFHLANAENELAASLRVLDMESHLLQSITGVIGAIRAIRGAV